MFNFDCPAGTLFDEWEKEEGSKFRCHLLLPPRVCCRWSRGPGSGTKQEAVVALCSPRSCLILPPAVLLVQTCLQRRPRPRPPRICRPRTLLLLLLLLRRNSHSLRFHPGIGLLLLILLPIPGFLLVSQSLARLLPLLLIRGRDSLAVASGGSLDSCPPRPVEEEGEGMGMEAEEARL